MPGRASVPIGEDGGGEGRVAEADDSVEADLAPNSPLPPPRIELNARTMDAGLPDAPVNA